MKKIKGILINPAAQSITEVELEEGESSFLDDMYNLLDCDTVDCVHNYFTRPPYCSHDDLWVDDEGLFKIEGDSVQWGFTLYDDAQPIVGKGLILGVDLTEGECMSHTLTPSVIQRIRENINWGYFIFPKPQN